MLEVCCFASAGEHGNVIPCHVVVVVVAASAASPVSLIHRRLERRNKALKAADRMTRRDVIHDAHSESLLNRANRIEGDAAGHRSGGGGGGGGGGGAHPISPQGAATVWI